MAWKIFEQPEKSMKNAVAYKVVETPTGRQLSEREFQVLGFIARGVSPSAAANELGLSTKTVATYRARILEKMGMKSNAEVAVWAYRKGLLIVETAA